ncbi:uncharacterized protein EV420DRAFT_1526236 [Desarmillaria tabescens]|uniref:Uncharacterized protein n=1 Tax=Armillaria tabescens TaxID=1929756 RepID=A0AA39N9T4_ARMTA|nr:uncharacterized protein EV420DRAFT_1526236 [Desarmillaria tabescens]KAK0461614.1 hypothetical protein EV420DRAFT_1526236 [Desarmillaria tabescens]
MHKVHPGCESDDHKTVSVIDTVSSCKQTYEKLPRGHPLRERRYRKDVVYSFPMSATSSLSSGASISAVLPTVLALVGAGPIELVETFISSPLRAVAMCVFGIGLPSGLFRQLSPKPIQRVSSSHAITWNIRVRQYTSLRGVLGRIFADLAILTLAGITLWRTWLVDSITMVTFRCEYSWLLFCWPMACVGWLVIVMLGWIVVAKDVSMTFQEEKISWREALLLPYKFWPEQRRDETTADNLLSLNLLPVGTEEMLDMNKGRTSVQHRARPDANSSASTAPHLPSVKVTFTVRWDGLWPWYEAALEALAVEIYLYGTIVLGSTLFLTGEQSIIYLVITALSLAASRIINALL